MKLEVKEQIKIPDGLHTGVIIDVEYRNKPYEYTDVIIEFKHAEMPIKLKAGYPTVVSDSSKLGKLLDKFGAVMEVGGQIDPNEVLIGKKCKFQTVTEETSKGSFAKILSDTVKPA